MKSRILILYFPALLFCFACEKDDKINYSLLETFEWEHISYNERDLSVYGYDTIIHYSDTTRYSFAGSSYIVREQITNYGIDSSSGTPVVYVNQTNTSEEGDYRVDTLNDLLYISYLQEKEDPDTGLPTESKYTTLYKILKLNEEVLMLHKKFYLIGVDPVSIYTPVPK